jgi:hypothetical protein
MRMPGKLLPVHLGISHRQAGQVKGGEAIMIDATRVAEATPGTPLARIVNINAAGNFTGSFGSFSAEAARKNPEIPPILTPFNSSIQHHA